MRHLFYLALLLLSARCHLPMLGVPATSTEQPPRARFRTVHASGLKTLRNCRKPAHDRFACTRKRQSRQWLVAFVADAFILPFSLRAALRGLRLRLSLPTARSAAISCGAVSGELFLPEPVIVGSPLGAWRSIVRLGTRVAANSLSNLGSSAFLRRRGSLLLGEMRKQTPALGISVLSDNALCLHHGKDGARYVSFVFFMTGVDAK